ncbi:MAG: flagellar hook-associated family protein [Hoeflea sp.]|uniref:flagellar hook-associated family protein n=1 Tax=Hoeflea sp. TaxID=1940281 RepID=UPI001D764B0E|nr:flagellar hook-associated family protein [Hoeflea sp.]MBU4528959.1 flagellar hook-associated family protein [Alphaproteobacteria bacterium]MBU4544092.1 flagellar hook-associated family protein [Alphaproteobacteria bacterium]MBU4551961.1 flagellar hook-associated family protein [Alphaproteobacteria bacterium]MBV1723426.1 flagellar hook-associated family protein [Hoeflea sp.]MBV1760405.1 flagellar hook-associated family protein [Hoeflea sp.]
MKVSFISNLAMQNSMRLTISRGQNEVQTLQKEIVTGRFADIGLALGAKTSNSVSLNQDVSRLKTIQDSNALVTQRLSASQSALGLMADSAQQMLEAFITVNGSDDANNLLIARRDVEYSLGSFTVAANTSSNGEYLFSGINTNTKPVEDYFEAGSTPKAAFDALFAGHFLFSQDDPLAAGITVAQMDDFLTNVLEPAFSGGDWNMDWSSASDTNISSRILSNEVVETSVNANAEGMRNFALAAVIGIELLDSAISSEVRIALNAKAIEYAGKAVTGIDNQRSNLGVAENRVTKADVALESQIKIITLHLGAIEGVDAYEASTRMQTLLDQVEMSYTLTARIQQMSLMNYL